MIKLWSRFSRSVIYSRPKLAYICLHLRLNFWPLQAHLGSSWTALSSGLAVLLHCYSVLNSNLLNSTSYFSLYISFTGRILHLYEVACKYRNKFGDSLDKSSLVVERRILWRICCANKLRDIEIRLHADEGDDIRNLVYSQAYTWHVFWGRRCVFDACLILRLVYKPRHWHMS